MGLNTRHAVLGIAPSPSSATTLQRLRAVCVAGHTSPRALRVLVPCETAAVWTRALWPLPTCELVHDGTELSLLGVHLRQARLPLQLGPLRIPHPLPPDLQQPRRLSLFASPDIRCRDPAVMVSLAVAPAGLTTL